MTRFLERVECTKNVSRCRTQKFSDELVECGVEISLLHPLPEDVFHQFFHFRIRAWRFKAPPAVLKSAVTVKDRPELANRCARIVDDVESVSLLKESGIVGMVVRNVSIDEGRGASRNNQPISKTRTKDFNLVTPSATRIKAICRHKSSTSHNKQVAVSLMFKSMHGFMISSYVVKAFAHAVIK